MNKWDIRDNSANGAKNGILKGSCLIYSGRRISAGIVSEPNPDSTPRAIGDVVGICGKNNFDGTFADALPFQAVDQSSLTPNGTALE